MLTENWYTTHGFALVVENTMRSIMMIMITVRIADRKLIGVRKMNNRKLKFCPDLTQVVWEKAMMVGNGGYQRIQLNECIKEQCVAYCREDGKCHKYMNEVEND